jgi:ribulose-5-phosphate 4-epimerase/fuculose-1-phosphate aldolase
VRFHGRYSFHGEYGGRIVDEEEGDRLAKAVGDGVRVVLLANHGVLVVGETAAAAWYDLYMFERACMVQVLAASTGQELRPMPEDVAVLAAEQFDEERAKHSPLLLAAERRRLDRELPGYDA